MMLLEPLPRAVVVKVATPEAIVPVPRVEVPSRKVTEPVGVVALPVARRGDEDCGQGDAWHTAVDGASLRR